MYEVPIKVEETFGGSEGGAASKRRKKYVPKGEHEVYYIFYEDPEDRDAGLKEETTKDQLLEKSDQYQAAEVSTTTTTTTRSRWTWLKI